MNDEKQIVPAETADVSPLAVISKHAADPNFDVEKLERLMAMQERIEAKHAQSEYIRALMQFKHDCPPLVKLRERQGKETQHAYVALEEAAPIIDPILHRHGLHYSWDPHYDRDGMIGYSANVMHIGGHVERGLPAYAPPETSGSKKSNPLWAAGSTESYIKRRTLFSLLGIVGADVDNDGAPAPVETISLGQIADLRALLTECPDGTEAGFLKWMGAQSIEQIPANRYDQAVKALEKKRRQA